MTKFSALLKLYRERRGLSQSKLADKAWLDHSYVSRLEAGRRNPSEETIGRLARGLELSGQEYDNLLIAAGIMPDRIVRLAALLPDEPSLRELLDMLCDQDLPEHIRHVLQAGIQTLVTISRQMPSQQPLVMAAN